MKTQNLTLLLLLTISSSSGQGVWAPPGATWHYAYTAFAATGYVKIVYVGDTTISGQNCKALEKTVYWYNNFNSTFDTAALGTAFTYLQNDSVFYYRNNQFYLLYDFSGQPLDVWQVAENDANCSPDSLATVQIDSIGSIVINGLPLNWVSVSPTNNAYYGYYGKIMERIGCYDFYMFPEYVGCIADAEEGGPFRCYYDSAFGLYHKPSAPPCDYITSIHPPDENNHALRIFPNPFASEVTIRVPQTLSGTFRIEIYSMSGLKLQDFTTDEYLTTFDASGLPLGMYYISISDKNSRRFLNKIVKTQIN